MLPLGFMALLTVLLVLIFTGLQKVNLPGDARQKYVRGLALTLVLWLGYASFLATSGFLRVFTIPPRIALFIILPAFGAMAWFFFNKKHEDLIRAVPPAWPVYFQSFRIAVEILILGIYHEGLVSVEPTLEGYNFDMLTGLSAPVVAYLVFGRKRLTAYTVKIWNICGLLLLANVVFIFNSLILRPDIWGYAVSPIKPEFGTMPYLLIACFFMPLAVFLHFFSLAQLRQATLVQQRSTTDDVTTPSRS